MSTFLLGLGPICFDRLKDLQFIPLVDGTWTSLKGGPVCFPATDGLEIPTDLGLRLVDPEALKKLPTRKELFLKLGVIDMPSARVRDLIVNRYENKSLISLEDSVAHLRYVYWTQPAPFILKPQQSFFNPSASRNISGAKRSSSSWSIVTDMIDCDKPPSSKLDASTLNTSQLKEDLKASFEPFGSTYPCNGTSACGLVNYPIEEWQSVPSSRVHQAFGQNICYLPEYRTFSCEELRLADYSHGLRFPSEFKGETEKSDKVPASGDNSTRIPINHTGFSPFEPYEKEIRAKISIYDVKNRMIDFGSHDIYFPSKEEFGMYELQKLGNFGPLEQISVRFIHIAYLKSGYKQRRSDDVTWEAWLQRVYGISRYPKLTVQSGNSSTLSPWASTNPVDQIIAISLAWF
jgi:hypothetical protein